MHEEPKGLFEIYVRTAKRDMQHIITSIDNAPYATENTRLASRKLQEALRCLEIELALKEKSQPYGTANTYSPDWYGTPFYVRF